MLNFSLIVFFLAAAFLGLSGMLYRWRAFTNKKAWNGMVLPFAVVGCLLMILALVLIYIHYPR